MKRLEMEMSAEMPIGSKEVEKKRKDELDWKGREGRDPREGKEKKGEGKRPTTVTCGPTSDSFDPKLPRSWPLRGPSDHRTYSTFRIILHFSSAQPAQHFEAFQKATLLRRSPTFTSCLTKTGLVSRFWMPGATRSCRQSMKCWALRQSLSSRLYSTPSSALRSVPDST